MKTNKLFGSLLAMFVGVVLFVPCHALAAAFGVSPPWIENENLKPDSGFVYVINLSANELTDNMIVSAKFEGDPEITQWLKIENQDKLVMAKGQSVLPMSVDVTIPADAKVGKYTGTLRLTLTPENGSTDNVAIRLGGTIEVKLGVVNNDVTDYWVNSINTDPISEGQPISLKMEVKNVGNTTVSNIMTKVTLVDSKTGTQAGSGSTDKLDQPIYPQTMTDAGLSISVPNLKNGDYWLDVEAFKDGKSVYKNRLFLPVGPSAVNNSVKTAVEVPGDGWVKPAAAEGNKERGQNVDLKTSVTVRAPMTNALIATIIGILLILTGVVVKIYLDIKKKHR